MRSTTLVCAAAVLVLSACNGGATSPSAATTAPSATSGETVVSQPAPTASAPKEPGTITASGFGQHDEYLWVTAVVHNNSATVGQTVRVNFNVLDSKGNLLKSESQVESFYRPDADHSVGTQVALERGQKAAKVEASLDVEDAGAFSDKPFPAVPISKMKVGKDQFGRDTASFELTNPLKVALRSPQVGVVCTNAAGAIVGGGVHFPDLVPASGKVKLDVDVLVSGKPTACSTYVGPPTNWGGEGTDTPEPAEPSADGAPASSAEAAFKTWVDQFNARNWAAQYDTMVNAQKAVISKSRYVACRSQDAPPKFTWVKVLSVTDAGATDIPGTKVKLPSTKVKVQLSLAGVKTPIEAHMYQEDGQWRWSMTQENLDGCR